MKLSPLLCVGLVGLNAYQYIENGRLKRQLADSKSITETKSVLTAPAEPSLESRSEFLAIERQEQDIHANSGEACAFPSTASEADRWRLIMSNPAMKEKVKSRRKSQIESDYGNLIVAFNFDDDEHEHFVDLLIETRSVRPVVPNGKSPS